VPFVTPAQRMGSSAVAGPLARAQQPKVVIAALVECRKISIRE
jgi:hypothetical protein